MPVIRDFEVGGIYHIFNRGWGKKNIFLDETDFLRFIVSLYWFNNDNNITNAFRENLVDDEEANEISDQDSDAESDTNDEEQYKD